MATQNELKAWQDIVGATVDGKPGPETFNATVQWLRAHGYIAPLDTPEGFRTAVKALAEALIRPWAQDEVDALWTDVGCPEFVGHWHDKAWCGAFALRCLMRALPACADWTWHPGKGFLEVYGLPKVKLPEVGDIAYFARNQHHAIVVGVGSGKVTLVNGNGMLAPAEGVTHSTVAIGDVSAFYSIGKLG